MVKKKISGQTIAIIILGVLLLLTIGFGGVFAYYSARSNKVSGRIVMANLKISMESGTSDKSEIVISNGVNVVPGQPLENSPLIVKNLSSVNIYLVVVYEINATKKDDDDKDVDIVDQHKDPVLGLGVEYINLVNPDYPSKNNLPKVVETNWIDYVFDAQEEGKIYRCLVSTKGFDSETDVTVIDENMLSLSSAMGNEYQNASISFTFQAYAIASNDDSLGIASTDNSASKCEKIVSAIYQTQSYKFLNIDVNK